MTGKKIEESHEELNNSMKSGRSLKSNINDANSIEGFLERKNVKIQLLFLKMMDQEVIY